MLKEIIVYVLVRFFGDIKIIVEYYVVSGIRVLGVRLELVVLNMVGIYIF